MDLKTGELYWPTRTNPSSDRHARAVSQAVAPLHSDIECDVLVIGAGISGALAACLLAEAGRDVVVVDRRGPVSGSTPASTALVQYEIDTPLIDLAALRGLDHARRAYRATRRALDDLHDLTARHQIECGIHWCGSLFLATRPDEYDRFVREADARRSVGIEVLPLTRRELADRFALHRPGALFSTAALELDPSALTWGLLEAAVHRGARLHAPAEVQVHQLPRYQGDRFTLLTDTDSTIRSRHVVFAMGYETPEQFPDLTRLCTLKSTYALVSEPLAGPPPWPGRVLIWESGSPYFYARQTPDRRVIIGGEDEEIVDPAERDALIDIKAEQLCQTFDELCPDVDLRPEFTWAGTFAETEDGLPYIGRPGNVPPGCHFALGYGGNGITFSVLAAQIIRDGIEGRRHPDAELFAFEGRTN